MVAVLNTTNRFHNVSQEMLADLIGDLDRKAKDASAEFANVVNCVHGPKSVRAAA